MRFLLLFVILLFTTLLSIGQESFNRKDSLRGNLTPLRTCYDVTFYNLFLIIDVDAKSIEKSFSEIYFTSVADFQKIQIDLASNLEIMMIEFEDKELLFEREFDAVFVYFPRVIKKEEQSSIKVWYRGNPRVAVNPPWDGGFFMGKR